MADSTIRNEFIAGVMEVYTTLMNNGSEMTDGVFFYMPSDKNKLNSVYSETKFKHYSPPVLLVCKAQLTPTQGEQDVEGVKDISVFTVPSQSLVDNGIPTSHADLDTLRRGIMKFHDVWYLIDNVSPMVYVEDTFLLYKFDCTEQLQFDEEAIIIDEPEEETPPEGGDPETPETPPEEGGENE